MEEELEDLIANLCSARDYYLYAIRRMRDYYDSLGLENKKISLAYGELFADMQEFAEANPSEEMSFFMGTLLQKIEKRVNEKSIDKDVEE